MVFPKIVDAERVIRKRLRVSWNRSTTAHDWAWIMNHIFGDIVNAINRI